MSHKYQVNPSFTDDMGSYRGEGWELATVGRNYKEARQHLREYRENDPTGSFRIVHKRVPKQ